MVLYGQNSDRMKERRWHLVVGALFGAFGLAMAGRITGNETVGMLALTCATMGILAVVPLFWTLPTAFLRGASAAAGIAVINSVGNLAGFISPYMVGAIVDATGSATNGLYAMAGFMTLGALLTIPATLPVASNAAVV